jgi:hypothetical protein
MTVRVLVGNQDVSPPMSMSDAEEDDDDVDNWDRGEMNSDGSLIITKTTSIREPMISNVIGFMDGLGLATEMTDERIEQNAYYCG